MLFLGIIKNAYLKHTIPIRRFVNDQSYITLPNLFVPLCPALIGFSFVVVLGVPKGFDNNN